MSSGSPDRAHTSESDALGRAGGGR